MSFFSQWTSSLVWIGRQPPKIKVSLNCSETVVCDSCRSGVQISPGPLALWSRAKRDPLRCQLTVAAGGNPPLVRLHMELITSTNYWKLVLFIGLMEAIALVFRELFFGIFSLSFLYGFTIAFPTMLICLTVFNYSPIQMELSTTKTRYSINKVNILSSSFWSGVLLGSMFTIQHFIEPIENISILLFGFLLGLVGSCITIILYNILPYKIILNTNLSINTVSYSLCFIIGIFEAFLVFLMDSIASSLEVISPWRMFLVGGMSGLGGAVIGSLLLMALFHILRVSIGIKEI